MILPSPRKVLRYSAAVTAGYALTAQTISWLMEIARWMARIAMLSFILALASLYTWITAPHHDGYLLIYFTICCAVALTMVAPMLIIACITFRLANDEDEHHG
jgi:hypothetical protein